MAELKTQPNDGDVDAFLDGIENDQKRADCRAILKMIRGVTRQKPQMWGDAIIGFGRYKYRYASGREAEWFLAGFSPRLSLRPADVRGNFGAGR